MAYFAIGLPIAILIRLFAGVPLFWFIVIPITILTFIGIAKMDETSILAARKFKDGKSIDSLADDETIDLSNEPDEEGESVF